MRIWDSVSMVVASGALAAVITIFWDWWKQRRTKLSTRSAVCIELQTNIEALANFYEKARDGESPRDLQLGSLHSRFTRGKLLPSWDQTMWVSQANRLPDAFSDREIEELMARQRVYREIVEMRTILAPHFETDPHRLERMSRPMWLSLIEKLKFLVDTPIDACKETKSFGNPARISGQTEAGNR